MPGPKSPWDPESTSETTNPWDEQAPTASHVAKRVELAPPGRRHTLELKSGPGAPRLYTLDKGEIVIGRSAECAVRIDSGDVSRKHLRLTLSDEEYTFEDLSSRNGVFLNGVKVHSAVLRNDDQIQVGDAVLVYHEGS
jgi:pSer/pThr/pTyr-binding forkhead associated (FHA) protein